MTPRARIVDACTRRGRRVFVADCAAVLASGEPTPDLLVVLGGPAAERMQTGSSRADDATWARTWAARGLLWALDPATVPLAAGVVRSALGDPAWRVREKAAQIVARHRIDTALPALPDLRDRDPVARVRAAADRALRALTAGP